MNNILKIGTVAFSSMMLVSSISIDPYLVYEWNNCSNSQVKVFASGSWNEVESYIGNTSQTCNSYMTVSFYDYDTFLKVVELTSSIKRTKYYSTNLYAYTILEIEVLN
jgi:hypothetical protein